jgi:hypothetical protein
MENRKKTLKIIAILIITILIIVLAYFIFFKKKDGTNNENVELESIPIANNDITVNIEDDIYEIDQVETPILKISENIQIEFIEEIIENKDLNLKLLLEIEGVSYRWCNSEETRCIVYDVIPNTLSFSFSEAPLALDVDVSNIQDPKEIWSIFLEEFGIDIFEYTNQKISRNDSGFNIVANRAFNEIPFENISYIQYSDILRFDKKGFLLSGKLLIVDFLEEDKQDLVNISKLGDIINNGKYPKQYIVDKSTLNIAQIQEGQDVDYNYSETVIDIQKCIPNDIELVYIFKTRNTSEYIIPAYKIYCNGELEYDSKLYTLPVFVYTNAISPENITVE